MALNLLQAVYVLDFFFNEDWYVQTVDISHDHFGFMLAWGDTVFLPAFYTLQCQYLARHPNTLSTVPSALVLITGLAAYAMFRAANHQRLYVRRHCERFPESTPVIWNQPARVLKCTYTTSDGHEHNTVLLASGWWGVARHFNYLADLVQAGCMCVSLSYKQRTNVGGVLIRSKALCGFEHVLPWLYFIYMLILLCHRVHRNDRRCYNKYGPKWEEYCRMVPYRILPGVY